MPDLDDLRSLSHQMVPPAFESLVDTARRRDRRAAGAWTAAVVSAAVATLAVVVVVSGPGSESSRLAPAPTPSSSVTSFPPGRAADFVPEVTPDDLRRWEVAVLATNTDPAHLGATELQLEVPIRDRYTTQWSAFCSGDPDTWFVYIIDDTGASGSGTCDMSRSKSLQPLPTDVSPLQQGDATPETLDVRMFVTGPIPQEHLDCFDRLSPPECVGVEPRLEPLSSTDVEFGVAGYEHWAPTVAEAGGQRFGALASTDGVDYVLRRVVQGPGTSPLTIDLDPNGPELLVGAVQAATEALIACGREATTRKESLACEPGLELRLGARIVTMERGTFGDFGDFPRLLGPPLYRVPAGTTGQIDFSVTRGAPEHADLAILVFEIQQQ